MKLLLAVLLALFAFTCVSASDVVILTPDNFDDVVDGSKNVFIEFFAPWCGHCKNLAPEYEIFATAFKKNDDIVIASVDADKHPELGKRFGVRGFPTLKFFGKGSDLTEPTAYPGQRTADALVEWINKETGANGRIAKPPSNVVVLNKSNFDKVVMDDSKNVLVEFYAPWCGHCKKLTPIYEELATVFAGDDDVVIAKMDADEAQNRDVASKYGVTGFPTLKYFSKDNKEEPDDYSKERKLEIFVDYINNKAGTLRNTDGFLKPEAGKLEEFDELAKNFVSGDESALKTAEEKASKVDEKDKKSATFYVKFMKVYKKRGSDFPEKETARLTRMIESGSVTPKKVDEFVIRRNILTSFQ